MLSDDKDLDENVIRYLDRLNNTENTFNSYYLYSKNTLVLSEKPV